MAFVGHTWRSLNFTVFSEVVKGNAFCNTLLVQHFSDQGFTSLVDDVRRLVDGVRSLVDGVASILWVTHTHREANTLEAVLHCRRFNLPPRVFQLVNCGPQVN